MCASFPNQGPNTLSEYYETKGKASQKETENKRNKRKVCVYGFSMEELRLRCIRR